MGVAGMGHGASFSVAKNAKRIVIYGTTEHRPEYVFCGTLASYDSDRLHNNYLYFKYSQEF